MTLTHSYPSFLVLIMLVFRAQSAFFKINAEEEKTPNNQTTRHFSVSFTSLIVNGPTLFLFLLWFITYVFFYSIVKIITKCFMALSPYFIAISMTKIFQGWNLKVLWGAWYVILLVLGASDIFISVSSCNSFSHRITRFCCSLFRLMLVINQSTKGTWWNWIYSPF